MKGPPVVYPILDSDCLARRGNASWLLFARGLIAGGTSILQLRHKGDWTREALAQAEELARECHDSGVTLVVNDRADIAKLLGASLHVGQTDLTPEQARPIVGDEAVVGFSTHNLQQIEAAQQQPADYLAFGPIFSTASKLQPDPETGLEGLQAARSRTVKPLVAIGGITLETARTVLASGADSVAVIGAMLPDTLTESAVRNRMEEWQRHLRN